MYQLFYIMYWRNADEILQGLDIVTVYKYKCTSKFQTLRVFKQSLLIIIRSS